jgi:hypothetical protein
VLAAGAALALLAAGCGSKSTSSSNPASTGTAASTPTGWQVVSKRTASGTKLGLAGGTTLRPGAVEVKVEATPNVKTQISYSIDCDRGLHATPATVIADRSTPITATIPLPNANASSCFVSATASKSGSADMTITVLARQRPGP